VAIDERPRRVSVHVVRRDGRAKTLRFDGPAGWPAQPTIEIVRRAERAIGSLRSLVVHSRLASDAEHSVTTIYKMVAPDRLAYRNVGGGESVIIGTKRWDRQRAGDWVASRHSRRSASPRPSGRRT
jgi:hypothetical protein